MTTKHECRYCATTDTKRCVAKDFCIGCKNYFCKQHFKEHEEHLATLLTLQVEHYHNDILGQLAELDRQRDAPSALFDQIEQWEIRTKEAVAKAAEIARDKLANLIIDKRFKLLQDLQLINNELRHRDEEKFLEYDIEQLRLKLNEIKKSLNYVLCPDTRKIIIAENNSIDWNQMIYIRGDPEQGQIYPMRCPSNLTIPVNAKWKDQGVIVAGGNGGGNQMNQLFNPTGIYIDDDEKAIFIADYGNHRIMKWEWGAVSGQVVAGGNGQGNGAHQLCRPEDVVLDRERDSIIICDRGNRRVVRWPRRNATSGETIITDIKCRRSTMDENGCLYVIDCQKHEVKRYKGEDLQGTVVAGGNGQGDRLDQLNDPSHLFVDRNHSVYVSDLNNRRIMKWVEGAREGILVAGGHGEGNGLMQISRAEGLVVDRMGTIYVADPKNSRISRWVKENMEGSMSTNVTTILQRSKQLTNPIGLSFDREGNLYAVDFLEHHVIRFDLIR